MNFQQVLMELNRFPYHRIFHFNSDCTALLLDCSIKEASKYLSRLHHMGFLNRKRFKRLCISKRGKACNKGYYYEYSFSRQGQKYLQWMIQHKPVEEIYFFKMINEAFSEISDGLKMEICFHMLFREEMKYKGSNRRLQNLGILTYAIPTIVENMRKVKTERDELKEKCNRLEKTVKARDLKIKNLTNENRCLKEELERERKKIYQFFKDLTQNLSKYMQIEANCMGASQLMMEYYEKMARELAYILYLTNRESAITLLNSIHNSNNYIVRTADTFLKEAKKILSSK